MFRLLVLVILYPRDDTRYSIEGLRRTLQQMWPLFSSLMEEFDNNEFNQVIVQLLQVGDIDIKNADITLSASAKEEVEKHPLLHLLRRWTKDINLPSETPR